MPSVPIQRIRLNPETFAITAVTYQRCRIFQRTANAELMMNTLLRYREQKRFKIHGFAIMPDHIHVLMTPAQDQSIERCVQLIKGGFSFAVRKTVPGETWQNGYHAHRITDEDDCRNQLLYIAKNPERKNLLEHLYVHTHHISVLDETPQHLTAP